MLTSLLESPNNFQTGHEFTSGLVAWTELRGNAYCLKNTVRGRVRELLPFKSTEIEVVTGVATNGNSPRNLLDRPGFRVVDLALSRDFRLPRRMTLRFRAEGTNVFNIVNYGQPGAAVPSGATSTTIGVIRSANAMRRLQLGARLTF